MLTCCQVSCIRDECRDGVYRVLNLHRDALLLQEEQHAWIQTLGASPRPQNQNLCKTSLGYYSLLMVINEESSGIQKIKSLETAAERTAHLDKCSTVDHLRVQCILWDYKFIK